MAPQLSLWWKLFCQGHGRCNPLICPSWGFFFFCWHHTYSSILPAQTLCTRGLSPPPHTQTDTHSFLGFFLVFPTSFISEETWGVWMPYDLNQRVVLPWVYSSLQGNFELSCWSSFRQFLENSITVRPKKRVWIGKYWLGIRMMSFLFSGRLWGPSTNHILSEKGTVFHCTIAKGPKEILYGDLKSLSKNVFTEQARGQDFLFNKFFSWIRSVA